MGACSLNLGYILCVPHVKKKNIAGSALVVRAKSCSPSNAKKGMCDVNKSLIARSQSYTFEEGRAEHICGLERSLKLLSHPIMDERVEPSGQGYASSLIEGAEAQPWDLGR